MGIDFTSASDRSLSGHSLIAKQTINIINKIQKCQIDFEKSYSMSVYITKNNNSLIRIFIKYDDHN